MGETCNFSSKGPKKVHHAARQPADLGSVTQLIRSDLRAINGSDHWILPYLYPSAYWQPGDIVPDWHEIDVPADLPDGVYRWGAGVYVEPRLLSATCFEDDKTISPTETAVIISRGSSKVIKAYLGEAFRSGGGVGWSAFGQDMVEAQGDFNRPWLLSSFGKEHLPSIPDVHERLVLYKRLASNESEPALEAMRRQNPALRAIGEVQWVPDWGRQRIEGAS